MMDDNEKRINDKVKFFYNEKCRVHVKRFDHSFWNGIITDKKRDGVYGFLEDKFGECLLFIADITDIDICRSESKW